MELNIELPGGDELLRALDRIAAALERLTPVALEKVVAAVVENRSNEGVEEPAAEPAPAAVEEKATESATRLTQDEIRARVVRLASAGKKDLVRAVVKSFAPSVPELRPEQYDAVWAALDELEAKG